jgi:hypothetical protein
MTTKEFSQQFDVLLNSFKDYHQYGITLGQIITLNEYEKSLYLTMAQESIVMELVTGKNANNESFEKNEEVRRYLQALIHPYEISSQSNYPNSVSPYSQFFYLEDLRAEDVWYIIYEYATVGNGSRVTEVKAITHSEVNKILKNPFRSNFINRTFRLDVNDFTDKIVELINPHTIKTYGFRYLKKPSPIILEDFEEVSIGGLQTIKECELHESLHVRILGRAYEMALQAFVTARGNVPAKEQKENK